MSHSPPQRSEERCRSSSPGIALRNCCSLLSQSTRQALWNDCANSDFGCSSPCTCSGRLRVGGCGAQPHLRLRSSFMLLNIIPPRGGKKTRTIHVRSQTRLHFARCKSCRRARRPVAVQKRACGKSAGKCQSSAASSSSSSCLRLGCPRWKAGIPLPKGVK
jgi:hypothetical protein